MNKDVAGLRASLPALGGEWPKMSTSVQNQFRISLRFSASADKRIAMKASLAILLFAIPLFAQAPPGPGPGDKQSVDARRGDRGKTTYIAECITCHGAKARGTENGPDLVRSLVVLRDRYGNEIGSFLRKGHPTQSNRPASSWTQKQMEESVALSETTV